MVVLRSGREIGPSSSSSSIANESYHISKSVYASSREELIASRERAFAHLGFKKVPVENRPNPNPSMQLAEEALNYFNQHSPHKYKLLELHSVKPTLFGRFMHYHINFTAENTHVAAAPKEMFFTELTNSPRGVSVRLCESLGPKNSLSGEKLNGCYYCRNRNNVWHPSSGGFVRGADTLYKTVERICGFRIWPNNAIPSKHLPRITQLHPSLVPKNEYENVSERFDASLYATKALEFYNQRGHITYGLVKPGFVTRVGLRVCVLFHVNFTAKYTDDATAPEEIFFAEMTSIRRVLSCKTCTILKPQLISGDETVDKTNGCYFCHKFNNVLHPMLGGFVRGGDSVYKSEKELEDTTHLNLFTAC